jgi:hypothetical protein
VGAGGQFGLREAADGYGWGQDHELGCARPCRQGRRRQPPAPTQDLDSDQHNKREASPVGPSHRNSRPQGASAKLILPPSQSSVLAQSNLTSTRPSSTFHPSGGSTHLGLAHHRLLQPVPLIVHNITVPHAPTQPMLCCAPTISAQRASSTPTHVT